MKPAPFKYVAPTTRPQALAALARYGDDGKALAGGQSLVPLLAMRLARPSVIIDLNRVKDFAYLKWGRTGLAIGAMTRQHAVETDKTIATKMPLLTAATRWIGHPQIRTRGTVGGSLAHADPAAELPAVASVLDGSFVLANAKRERVVGARDFYVGYLTTALQPDELLTEVRLAAQPPGAGWAFTEVARRHGDFALCGVAVLLQCDARRRCSDARLAFFGVSHGPVRIADVEKSLLGKPITQSAADEAGRLASAALDPEGDIHASASYRKHVAGVLASRGIMEAATRIQVPV
jgi:CO/xanthine dehydrogenase FAD-binding subunit